MNRKEIDNMKTFTLRLSDEKSGTLVDMAEKLNMSQNSLINAFISLGLDAFNSQVNSYREQFSHFLIQTEQCTAQQVTPTDC
jgi:hypothetical protein